MIKSLEEKLRKRVQPKTKDEKRIEYLEDRLQTLQDSTEYIKKQLAELKPTVHY